MIPAPITLYFDKSTKSFFWLDGGRVAVWGLPVAPYRFCYDNARLPVLG